MKTFRRLVMGRGRWSERLPRQEGGIMVLAMVVVVAVGLMGAAMMTIGQSNTVTGVRSQQAMQARWIAEGGLYDAIADLRADRQAGNPIVSKSFNNSLAARANKVLISGTANGFNYTVVSRSQVHSSYATVQQVVLITNTWGYSTNYALISLGPIIFPTTGSATITGNVSLAGSTVDATVDGSVIANGSVTNQGVISGSLFASSGTVVNAGTIQGNLIATNSAIPNVINWGTIQSNLLAQGNVLNTGKVWQSLYSTNGNVTVTAGGKVYGDLFAQKSVTNYGTIGATANGNLTANGKVTNAASGWVYGQIRAYGSVTNKGRVDGGIVALSSPVSPSLPVTAPPPTPPTLSLAGPQTFYEGLIGYAKTNGLGTAPKTFPLILAGKTNYYKVGISMNKDTKITGPGTIVSSSDITLGDVEGSVTVVAGGEVKFTPGNPTVMSNCIFYGETRLYQDNQLLELKNCQLVSPGVIDAKSFSMTDDNSVILGGTINFYDGFTFNLHGTVGATNMITMGPTTIFNMSTSSTLPPMLPNMTGGTVRAVSIINMHGWTNNSAAW